MKIFTLLLACIAGFAVNAQTYGYGTSTGTADPFDYQTTGTSILSIPSTDVLSSWQTIPFSFNFYGQAVTGYYASDNGYITFDNSATTSYAANTSIPNAGGPNNAIYAFWDDVNIISGSGSTDEVRSWTYGTAPSRVHVIEWYSATPASGTGFIYAAIRLYECGDFDVVLNFGNASGMSATIGAENATGTVATQVTGSPNITYPSVGSAGADDEVYTFYWDQIMYDMSVNTISPSGMATVGNNTISGEIVNAGSTAVTSFDLHYTIDGGATQTMNVSANVAANGGTYNYSHSTPWNIATGGVNHTVCVWADNINGNADQRTCNDQLCQDVFATSGNSGTRTVLIEEFTGAWCGWCPDGAVVLEDILTNNPNDAVGVSIHDGDDMEFNDGIRSGFGVSAYPNGMVDRKVFPGEPDEPHSRGAWTANTASQIGSYTPADVTMTHTWNPSTRAISITVTGTFADYAVGDMRFVAMVVENGVTGSGSGYDQVNYLNSTAGHPYENAGDPIVGFVHEHVLRALPGGAFGNSGVIPGTVNPSDVYSETFNYTLPASYDENEVYLIGFMAYYSTTIGEREVIDVAQMDLGNTSLTENALVSEMEIYPNPATDVVNVDFELENAIDARINVFDMAGKVVGTITPTTTMSGKQHFSYDTKELENGVYFISVISDKGAFTERFQVSR